MKPCPHFVSGSVRIRELKFIMDLITLFSLSFNNHGTQQALTLDIPSSSVNIPCTVEHETPCSSAIALMVVLLSMLTMSLTESLMKQVTTAGQPLLKLSSVGSFALLERECHL